jgi:potassium-transporting ATPase KdpC subunit
MFVCLAWGSLEGGFMRKQLFASLRALLIITLIVGILYPLLVTGVAQMLFAGKARGSLVIRDGKILGSTLIAQHLASPKYFQPRPSAADYATIPSGASNLAPTSKALEAAIQQRKTLWGADVPIDLLTSSGSGLDPHISPESAYFQVKIVAQARGLSTQQVEILRKIVSEFVEQREFGFLGQPRVNVLKLNLAIDERLR